MLDGGPGSDTLFGGPGRDRLAGGDGRDRIVARDGRSDRVDCGAGGPDRAVADRRDRMVGCERRTRTIEAIAKNAVTSIDEGKPLVSLGVGCPNTAALACRGRVTFFDAGGRRIGGDAWEAAPGGETIALVWLRRRARAVRAPRPGDHRACDRHRPRPRRRR